MGVLEGKIDLHVHAGPDVRDRKLTAVQLVRKAAQAGMRALLLKNHHTSTVLAAAAIQEQVQDINVFGGLALNESVGGLNPAAVEAALRMGAAEIWFPTLSAENQRRAHGHPGSGIRVSEDDGRLKPEVHEIIRLVAEADAILGTGHLSPQEILKVVAEAHRAGVRRILVTHPEITFIRLPVEVQQELAQLGVLFERCYVRPPLYSADWDELARIIRQVGVKSTVLATDLGQPENPDPITGYKEMLEQLHRRGFNWEELEIMTRLNPAQLLGLD